MTPVREPITEDLPSARSTGPQPVIMALGIGFLVYVAARMIWPFLAAICWALALALLTAPLHDWLLRRSVPRTVAPVLIILLVLALIVGPGVLLVRTLAGEAEDIVNRAARETGTDGFRQALAGNRVIGPVVRWLGAQLDWPAAALDLARSAAGWASRTASTFLSGSLWLFGQIGVTLFVLFYFLRDGNAIRKTIMPLIPFPAEPTEFVLTRISRMIRFSLGGKIVVASIQGMLGGVIFFLLGLPAPVFWGAVMAALSSFPVIGGFIVWVPVAIFLAICGNWSHALVLAGWGMLIIHPVDNLLGPMLVGTALRLHTLLMFFAVIGGIAAFGGAGIVIGPMTVAVVVALFELKSSRLAAPVPPTG